MKEARGERLTGELALFSRLAAAVSSTLDLDRILDLAVEEVGAFVGADATSVYLLDPVRNVFVLRATRGLEEAAVGVTTIAWEEGITGWAAARGEIAAVADAPRDRRYVYKPETKEERYRSFLAVPLEVAGRVQGILTLQTRGPRDFSDHEIALVGAAGHQIAHAVHNARLYAEAKARLAEMTAIHDVVTSIGRTLDQRAVLDEIVTTAARILSARGSILRIREKGTGVLRIVAHAGMPRGFDPAQAARGPGEGISGWVAERGETLRVADVRRDERFRGEEMGIFGSILCVPMFHAGKVIGTIGVFDKTVGGVATGFTEADERLLGILAQQAAVAFGHAEVFGEADRLARDLARRVQELTIIHLVSKQLQGTLSIDEILFIVLTGITSGEGLGFNRGLILLTEPHERALVGAMGIGPTVEEVDRVWRTATATFRSLEDYFESVDRKTIEGSPFNRLVRSIRLPVGPDAPIPARAVVEGRPFIVRDAFREEGVDRGFVERIRTKAFAVVPVVSKEMVIGCVVVDNCFNFRPITEDDLRLLATLANQAGLAIEAARLVKELNEALERLEATHQLLAEAEKLAAIGEVATGVAHDIRNPITAIGGFARRLARRVEDEQGRQYLEIILREVERLETLAQNVLRYARGARRAAEPASLAAIAAEVVRAHAVEADERGLGLFLDAEEGCVAEVDREEIDQVLRNLVRNAMEATPRGGRIDLVVRSEGDDVRIEVRDTGSGVPPEIRRRIFEPFQTTKTKGTGLGLALAKKIVEAHGGRIEVESEPGKGAVFTIRLPSAKMREGREEAHG